jgi:hypothetical protein
MRIAGFVYFHTFENFKVVPNLVLMIYVSVQSTHKGLKSATGSEIVFWKVRFNPKNQMITTNSDQGKPKSTANFNLANA